MIECRGTLAGCESLDWLLSVYIYYESTVHAVHYLIFSAFAVGKVVGLTSANICQVFLDLRPRLKASKLFRQLLDGFVFCAFFPNFLILVRPICL